MVVFVDVNDRTFVGAVAVVVAFRTFFVAAGGCRSRGRFSFGGISIFVAASAVRVFCDPRSLFYFLPLFGRNIFFSAAAADAAVGNFQKRTLAMSRETFKFNKPKLRFS